MIRFNLEDAVERLYPSDKCPLNKVLDKFPITVNGYITSHQCWVAGGFIRRWYNNAKQDSDIDLFFKDSSVYDTTCVEMEKIAVAPPITTEFNTMYQIKVDDDWTINVQCIKHKYYNDIDELMDSFDFTICQFAYDGKDIVVTENALLDNHRKRLVPHKITYGVSSLRRIIKYTQQGYYMCGGSATNFLMQLKADPTLINSKVVSID